MPFKKISFLKKNSLSLVVINGDKQISFWSHFLFTIRRVWMLPKSHDMLFGKKVIKRFQLLEERYIHINLYLINSDCTIKTPLQDQLVD